MASRRDERRSGASEGKSAQGDSRSPGQRDRDRVLYSDQFRRLAGVTQVVGAAEGAVFHNRLTHSLKVAQVARRLAEHLCRKHGADAALASALDPDVTEAAALAHDIGHPPFGHVAEQELDQLAQRSGLTDGFEGNAQSFRVVARLSTHNTDAAVGLDLTRATLRAVVKYPWLRSRDANGKPTDDKHGEKFAAYDDDEDALEFAIGEPLERGPHLKSVEAQVMDLADSITYSVHDFEDFYRAGMIPLERIVRNPTYYREFLKRWEKARPGSASAKHFRDVEHGQAMRECLELCIADEVDCGCGSRDEQRLLESFRSHMITRIVGGVRVSRTDQGPSIELDPGYEHELRFLQRLVWQFVIQSPRLATQQCGQRAIVGRLFERMRTAALTRSIDLVPARFQWLADVGDQRDKQLAAARFAVDVVASLAEAEAILLDRRLLGVDVGSVADIIS